MQTRAVSPEVRYPDERVVVVDATEVKALKQAAWALPRRRIRLCTHRETGDRLHEMFIVHARDAYVRPHRQRLGKSESLHVIEGELDVVLFDDAGEVVRVMTMGEFRSGRPFYYRVEEPFYHSVRIRSEVAVFHEVTNGPFEPGDTEFATWAPEEADQRGVEDYLLRLDQRLAVGSRGAR